jgi:hypothetical protein
MSLGLTQMLAGEICRESLLFNYCIVSYHILILFCDVLSVLVVTRFFKQYLLMLAINQMAASLFRFIGGVGRNMIVANVYASFMLLIFMVLGGFVLVRGMFTYPATLLA